MHKNTIHGRSNWEVVSRGKNSEHVLLLAEKDCGSGCEAAVTARTTVDRIRRKE